MPSSQDLDQDIARLRAQLKELANEAKQAGCLQDRHDDMDRAPPPAAATQLDRANQPQVSTELPVVCMGHVFLPSGCLCKVAPHGPPLQADVLSSAQQRTPALPISCPSACATHPPDLLVVQSSVTTSALSAHGCTCARCPHSASLSRQMCAATTGSHSYRPPASMSS